MTPEIMCQSRVIIRNDIAADGALATNPRLHVLGVLNGGFPKPEILRTNPYDPGGSWEQFVNTVVNEYRNRGVDAWEVGN